MIAEYSLHKHRLGWLLCAKPGDTGGPLTAMDELTRLFPNPSQARICPDIAHHINTSGNTLHVVLVATCSPEAGAEWRAEIEQELARITDPEVRWWRGLHVGLSSACLFSMICTHANLSAAARRMGQSHAPRDAEDFGRCVRMLDTLGYHDRLGAAAIMPPSRTWALIFAEWETLLAMKGKELTNRLFELNEKGAEPVRS